MSNLWTALFEADSKERVSRSKPKLYPTKYHPSLEGREEDDLDWEAQGDGHPNSYREAKLRRHELRNGGFDPYDGHNDPHTETGQKRRKTKPRKSEPNLFELRRQELIAQRGH